MRTIVPIFPVFQGNVPIIYFVLYHMSHGIQEVSGSIPLISTKSSIEWRKTLKSSDFKVFYFPKVENLGDLQKASMRLIFDGNFENQEVR